MPALLRPVRLAARSLRLTPAFTLLDDHGQKVSLKSLRGRDVILYAYPAAMTPGCTTQACDFRDSLERFTAAGYK